LSQESRTYVPLTESGGNGAPLVPSNFEVRLKNLMLADGPLFAGSPLITNIYATVMRSTRILTSDDTTSTGVIVSEATNIAEAELTGLSSVSVGGTSNRYSTGILVASVELVQDADSFMAFEDIVARAAGQRLSRIQNSTNLTMLKTGLAANISAAVSPAGGSIAAADVYTLVGAVGAAYRSNATFIMSKQKQAALGAVVTTAGIREFPQVLEAQPKLLGYDVHIINSAASADILFGDFSFITGKSTPVEMRVLHERFRDQGQYGYIMAERAEAKWSVASSSDSPVKYLSFAS
jgi:HK97 family phage major capsid protein